MGSGWQTVLADLSMILFMVTAAGVSQSPPEPPPSAAQPPQTPALGEPVALWRDETVPPRWASGSRFTPIRVCG